MSFHIEMAFVIHYDDFVSLVDLSKKTKKDLTWIKTFIRSSCSSYPNYRYIVSGPHTHYLNFTEITFDAGETHIVLKAINFDPYWLLIDDGRHDKIFLLQQTPLTASVTITIEVLTELQKLTVASDLLRD